LTVLQVALNSGPSVSPSIRPASRPAFRIVRLRLVVSQVTLVRLCYGNNTRTR